MSDQSGLLMTIACFSQRLLNPFRGITCTIRYKSAEAVTTDGRHWDIYVRNELMLDDVAEDQRHKVLTNDIRYGSWSMKQGLKRGPIYPSDDFEILEHYGDMVFTALRKHHRDTPFPLTDNLEFWLLDEDLQPLALLDSAIDAREMDSDQTLLWRPGMRCTETFYSHHCCRGGTEKGAAAAALARHIHHRSGPQPRAQWFRRSKAGAGVGLSATGLGATLENRRLAAGDFPRYHLQSCRSHARLIKDFEYWCAPWLLLLPHLDEKQRALLEPIACRQPTLVNDQFHLYPQIIDRRLFNTARVQAKLHQATQRAETLTTSDGHLSGSE